MNISPPIMNASGCWSSSYEQLDELLQTKLGAIVIKTCTLSSRKGNKEPTYYTEDINLTFNSKGLPNYGYEYYKEFIIENINKNIVLSITYDENTLDILEDLNKIIPYKTMVEINMSCPNVECHNLSYDIEKLKEALSKFAIFDNLIVGVKLSPYIDLMLMRKVASVINNSNIHYVVLSNSIPIYDYKNVLSTEYGGMSGKLNKYLSLSNVAFFSKHLENKFIVGCGGIENENDIEEYLKCGAKYVQLGSCFYDEKPNRLDYDRINDLCDKLFVN